MDILSYDEQEEEVKSSRLARIYNEEIDRESAYEILRNKISSSIQNDDNSDNRTTRENTDSDIGGTIKKIANSSITRTIVREVARGLFGILLGKARRTTSRR